MRKFFTLMLLGVVGMFLVIPGAQAQCGSTCPSYCDPTPSPPIGFPIGSKITRVQFFGITTIDKNTSAGPCDGDYYNYAPLNNTTVKRDSSYTLMVTHGECSGTSPSDDRIIWVWVDFNLDFCFDTTELVYKSPIIPSSTVSQTETTTVTIPAGASLGTTRMRVTVYESASTSDCGAACNDPNNPVGEAEDYGLTIQSASSEDLVLLEVSPPQSGCNLDTAEMVTFSVTNIGDSPQTGFDLCFSIDGGASICETISDTLMVGDTLKYTFTAGADLSTPGLRAFKGWTGLLADDNNTNDTLNLSINSLSPVVPTYPYLEDFEGGMGMWESGGDSNTWAFGTPAKTVIIGASSGTNAWVTGGLGTGSYSNNEKSYVKSPAFDFSGTSSAPWVKMDIWYESETAPTPTFGTDAAAFQYSTDVGETWTTLGNVGEDLNWYTGTASGLNLWWSVNKGWSGRGVNGSMGYIPAQYQFPPAVAGNGCVLTRVIFGSDNSGKYDGVAFDDFSLLNGTPTPISLGPDTLVCDTVFTLSTGIMGGGYNWSTGDTTETIDVTTDGTYSVYYSNADGLCSYDEVDVALTTLTAPTADFTWDTLPCPVVQFSNASSGTIDTYFWDFGDGSTSTDPNPAYSYTANGNYGAKLFVYNDCHVDSFIDTVVIECLITGRYDDLESEVDVFPNPTSGSFNVMIENPAASKAEIEVLSMQGQLILRKETGILTGIHSEVIDLTGAAKGLYFVRINIGGESIVRKVMIE